MLRPPKIFNGLIICCLIVGAGSFATPGWGQEVGRFIEVEGTASIGKPPNLARIRLTIAAQADTAKSAVKDFKRIRQSFTDQMGPMNFPDVTLKFESPKLQSAAMADMFDMMNGPFAEEAAQAGEAQFDCRAIVVLEMAVDEDPVKMLEQISKVIDAGLEAKATLPEQSAEMIYQGESGENLVRLTRDDLEDLKKQSHQKAFADAKRKAEELAAISGGKIGKVLQIKDQAQDSDVFYSFGYGLGFDSESAESENIEVGAFLSIRFQLED